MQTWAVVSLGLGRGITQTADRHYFVPVSAADGGTACIGDVTAWGDDSTARNSNFAKVVPPEIPKLQCQNGTYRAYRSFHLPTWGEGIARGRRIVWAILCSWATDRAGVARKSNVQKEPGFNDCLTGRYIPVRQLTSARTARYRAVPPKSAISNRFWLSTVNFNHRGSISVVDDRLRGKGEEEGEGEGEEKGEKYIARAALARLPRAIRRPRAKNHPCGPSLAGDSSPASNSFSPYGEKGRGYIISTTRGKEERRRGEEERSTSFPYAVLAGTPSLPSLAGDISPAHGDGTSPRVGRSVTLFY
ncbi:hypothetical protein B296_00043502 [Ensete ventricosum]|uniref:Uncharacterized protein n=1 Tax=Ensete ventricosum TaxID=4639 RepID=A0A426XMG9_ENSVE|nr:hypothetical protein B296_00043502 [Ensete ventricosum]